MSAYLGARRRARLLLVPLAFLTVVCLLLFTLRAANAQEGTDPTGATPTEATETVTGRVLNLAGNPVAGALVQTRACLFDPLTLGPCPLEDQATTGADGRYSFEYEGSPPYLYVSKEGYHGLWYKDAINPVLADPSRGEGGAFGDMVLSPSGGSGNAVVHVTVRGGGEPLSGVTAEFVHRTSGCDPEMRACAFEDTFPGRTIATTATGEFTVTVAGETDYGITLEDPSLRFVPPPRTVFHFSNPWIGNTRAFFPGNTYHLEYVFSPAAVITGTVTNADGEGVGGVTVRAQCGACSPTTRTAVTDANGAYTIIGLGKGSWTVTALQSDDYLEQPYMVGGSVGTLVLDYGDTRPNINIQVALQAKFTGKVTAEDGTPLEGIQVRATCVVTASPTCSSQTVTNVNGEYTVTGLESGDHRVQYSDPSRVFQSIYYLHKEKAEDATLVPLKAGETTTLEDTVLTRRGMITGWVVDEAGNPLGNPYAFATQKECDNSGGGPCTYSALSVNITNGRYRIVDMPTGVYTVTAGEPMQIAFESECYDNVPLDECANATEIELAEQEVRSGVNFVLSRTDGTIPEPRGLLLTPGATTNEADLGNGQNLRIDAPAGSVDGDVRVTVASVRNPSALAVMSDAQAVDGVENATAQQATGAAVRFDAFATSNGAPIDDFTFKTPVTLTIVYTDSAVLDMDENALRLFVFNEETQGWEQEGITHVSRSVEENRIVVTVNRLGLFGLFEDPDAAGDGKITLWLPVITRE